MPNTRLFKFQSNEVNCVSHKLITKKMITRELRTKSVELKNDLGEEHWARLIEDHEGLQEGGR